MRAIFIGGESKYGGAVCGMKGGCVLGTGAKNEFHPGFIMLLANLKAEIVSFTLGALDGRYVISYEFIIRSTQQINPKIIKINLVCLSFEILMMIINLTNRRYLW